MTNSTIICVLGAPRSGTSLTTRVLNLLGVYLGPKEHLMKPDRGNPKGTWEHALIHELNYEILSKLGVNSPWQPLPPPGWENSPELEDLKDRARTIIHTDFTGREMWCWKHPPTCLTLPFWQTLLRPMQYVICLRNPIDVAHSQVRYFGRTFEKGLFISLLFLKSALKYTTGELRILIRFEDFINNCQSELRHLARFVGKSERVDVERKVQEFIDENLWHHRTSQKDIACETKRSLSNKLLAVVLEVNEIFKQKELIHPNDMDQILQKALCIIGRNENETWMEQVHLATQDLDALIPTGDSLILVDEGQWGSEVLANRRAIPFIERKGQYWGSPPDDATAIQEFERLRRFGASFIVFGWPAFWWLGYYTRFYNHLRSNFCKVLENDRLIVFDLRAEANKIFTLESN